MTYKIHPHLKSLKRSATLAINEQCAKLTSAGITVTRFGFGQSPFPVPEFLVEELRKNAYRKEYLPVEGLYSLREAIAEYHSIADKIVMDPEGIIVGPGSKELIFTLQLVTKGTTLIPSPCWVSYGPQADIVQKKIHYIQTQYEHSWRLLPHELESAIQFTDDPQLLILNYPGNPGGGSYSPDELAAIAEVCRKYGVLVLSDEIYGRLHHNNDHISIARYYPEGTIVSSGLSKWCGAGGWRLGHFAFPKELLILKNMMTTITSETFSCVASPVQFAALKAYGNSPMINEYLFHCRRILKTIGNDCYYRLTSAGVRLIEPKGSFYLFPDFENFRKNLEKGK